MPAIILKKIGCFIMAVLVNLHNKYASTISVKLYFFIILDSENVGVGAIFISLSRMLSEILKKVGFSIMAVANLHMGNIYIQAMTL